MDTTLDNDYLNDIDPPLLYSMIFLSMIPFR